MKISARTFELLLLALYSTAHSAEPDKHSLWPIQQILSEKKMVDLTSVVDARLIKSHLRK